MTNTQARMLSGVLLIVAGAIIFAGGKNAGPDADGMGIAIGLLGCVMLGFDYVRSFHDDER